MQHEAGLRLAFLGDLVGGNCATFIPGLLVILLAAS